MAWQLGSVVMAAAAATMLLGCAVHLPKTTQVSFDYSDYTYYDRGYAPSPSSALAANDHTPLGYTERAEAHKAPAKAKTVKGDAAVDSAIAAGRADAAQEVDHRVADR